MGGCGAERSICIHSPNNRAKAAFSNLFNNPDDRPQILSIGHGSIHMELVLMFTKTFIRRVVNSVLYGKRVLHVDLFLCVKNV